MIEHGFTTQQVAEASGFSPSKISRWLRAGLVSPAVTSAGDPIFSFQDLVLFRTARDLLDADVPERRIRAAVAALRRQLPSELPLSALHISAAGDGVLVRDEDGSWEPVTGQLQIDFSAAPPAAAVTRTVRVLEGDAASADHWYDAGVDLESTSAADAMRAYRRALDLDPNHAAAHLNLGRLLHEAGDLDGAEAHYRAAQVADHESAEAPFNLGVLLEDLGRPLQAIAAYRDALELDEGMAAAHFNIGRLLEARGDRAGAMRHLAAYTRL